MPRGESGWLFLPFIGLSPTVLLSVSLSHPVSLAHLIASSYPGLTLAQATLIERTAIHSIRLVPRKARGHRNRVLALAGGVPAGLGAALGSWYIGCRVAGGCGEPPHPVGSAGFYAVLVAVPVLVYRFAARADRGALLIILNESVAHNPLALPGPQPVLFVGGRGSSEASYTLPGLQCGSQRPAC